ncbi:hypothetical protein Tco_1572553, partial [Tanacetum coccineum]
GKGSGGGGMVCPWIFEVHGKRGEVKPVNGWGLKWAGKRVVIKGRSSALPCKVSQLVTVETLHLGLDISSCVTSIDIDFSTSFLERPYCPHA